MIKTNFIEQALVFGDNKPYLVALLVLSSDQKNLENINCYSNEGNRWEKSKIKIDDKKLYIEFRESFIPRRGRINCSLNDNGKWRWFGTQFTVKLN